MTGRRPLDAAVIYARRGWPVFPCHNPTPVGCSCHHADCASPAKHPRVARGLNAATLDEAQVRQWWGRWPAANVAIRTGAPSGLVVIDIDPDHHGHRTLQNLIAEHGPLPSGRVVTTGTGGQHLYFAYPGVEVRNDAGRRLGPGIDIRGDRGYVIAPPSRHRNTRPYTLTARGLALPELPDWILTALQPPPPRRETTAPQTSVVRRRGDAWARVALDGELDRLGHAPEGARNDTLNRVAYRLGQIIGAGFLTEDHTTSLLIDRAVSIGLTDREAQLTTRSGLNAGQANPAGPRDRDDDADISL